MLANLSHQQFLPEDPRDKDTQPVQRQHRTRHDDLIHRVGGRRQHGSEDEDHQHRVLEVLDEPLWREEPHPHGQSAGSSVGGSSTAALIVL